MSTIVVREEIRRFLGSSAPEVLCVSGAWGVGKTFAWQRYLREIEAAGELAVERYAYVSLFGLDSLSELRAAVVENTVVAEGPLVAPDARTLKATLRAGERLGRRSRPLLDLAANLFGLAGAGEALYRAAFLSVRGQLVCFDDLERAGRSLDLKDVLGLASMLREQRDCKVVLLLNREQTGIDRGREFDEQLEKVVDTFLVFRPTSAEAVEIAIAGDDAVAVSLRSRIVALGITNVRVIKKIERMARQLAAILGDVDEVVLEQAISTVVLAGWSFLQPGQAPGLDFVRRFSAMGLSMRKDVPPEEVAWEALIRGYGYTETDELDALIVEGVSVGYFQAGPVREAAAIVEARARALRRDTGVSPAWRMFHESVTVDDDEVLDAMVAGVEEELPDIPAANINAAARFLRLYGRPRQVTELIGRWIEANRGRDGFFEHPSRLFFGDPVDPELRAAVEDGRARLADARDPAEVLKRMATNGGFDPEEDVALFSRLAPADIVRLFDDNPGRELAGMMQWARRLSGQPGGERFRAALDAALTQIASRSPMRYDRLRSWGVLPATAGDDDAETR